LNILWIFEKN